MTHESNPHQFEMTLQDQKFLKELGISGMQSGREALLRHQDKLAADLKKVKKRAEKLQSLDLDDKTYEQWSQEDGRTKKQLKQKKQLFRDLDED